MYDSRYGGISNGCEDDRRLARGIGGVVIRCAVCYRIA